MAPLAMIKCIVMKWMIKLNLLERKLLQELFGETLEGGHGMEHSALQPEERTARLDSRFRGEGRESMSLCHSGTMTLEEGTVCI